MYATHFVCCIVVIAVALSMKCVKVIAHYCPPIQNQHPFFPVETHVSNTREKLKFFVATMGSPPTLFRPHNPRRIQRWSYKHCLILILALHFISVIYCLVLGELNLGLFFYFFYPTSCSCSFNEYCSNRWEIQVEGKAWVWVLQ
jgi:hypothetical protein